MSEKAQIILNQLGGARIFAMAFRAPALTTDNSVTLRVAPALCRRAGQATHVRISLEAGDTYTVEVDRQENPTSRRESEVLFYSEGVYADQLKTTIESATGLRLSL